MNVVPISPLKTAHQNAFVNPSTATRTEIVPAAAGARYRVLGFVLTAASANTVVFESGTTAISCAFHQAAGNAIEATLNTHGWFETNVGEALNVSTSAAVATGIQIHYIKLAS